MFRHRVVCENHSDRAWHEELGCICGAGMPCKCNSGEGPDVSKVLIDEKDKVKYNALPPSARIFKPKL